jgi:hypothetical protein
MKRKLINAKAFLVKGQTSVSFSSSFIDTTRSFNQFKKLAEKEGLEVKRTPRNSGGLKNKITIRLKE